MPSHGATAYDLGGYVCTPLSTTEGQTCRTSADYSGIVYSDFYGKAYVLPGGGHSATYRSDVDAYNFVTRTRSSQGPPTPCADLNFGNLDSVKGRWISTNEPVSQHTYDLQAAVGDRIISMSRVQGRGIGCHKLTPVLEPTSPYVIAKSAVKYYTPETNSWEYTSVPALTYHSAIGYDPISGKILIASGAGLWLYDTTTNINTKILSHSNAARMGWEASLVYAGAMDKFYWMGRSGSGSGYTRNNFEITLNRLNPSASTVVDIGVFIPKASLACCSSGWAYDYDNGVIGGGVDYSSIYIFDPVSRSLTTQALVSDSGVVIKPGTGYIMTYGAGGYMFITKESGNGSRTFFVPQ